MSFNYRTASAFVAIAVLLAILHLLTKTADPAAIPDVVPVRKKPGTSAHQRGGSMMDERIMRKIQKIRNETPLAQQPKKFAETAWETIHQYPLSALTVIHELPVHSEERRSMIQVCAQNIFQEFGFSRATKWASSLNEEERSLAIQDIARLVADTDPPKALTLVADVSKGPLAGTPDSEAILKHWAMRNAADAVDWVTGLTSPEERALAYKTIFQQWVRTDEASARSWVASDLEPGIRHQAGQALDEAMAELLQNPAEPPTEGFPPISNR